MPFLQPLSPSLCFLTTVKQEAVSSHALLPETMISVDAQNVSLISALSDGQSLEVAQNG